VTDELSALIERWPTVLVAASTQGVVTGWSKAGERLLGIAQAQAVGRPLSALATDPGEVERALDHLRRSQTVQSVCLTTRAATNGDGGTPLFMCLDAQRDRAGVIREFIATLRDLRALAFHATPRGAPRSLVVPDPHALNGLTPRQRVVLELIAQGYSTQDIARRLNRSVKTVETHRAQLMKRLNVYHVPGLVAFAIRAGVVAIA
jgi:PAS domain S-box-containing protein